jgi:broad specificity phosphatase PhoE
MFSPCPPRVERAGATCPIWRTGPRCRSPVRCLVVARLLLLRHGQSTWNAEHRWQGWADPPLSPLGEEQARAAAAEMAGVHLDGVVSSDLRRARRTAEIIADHLGLAPVEGEPGLRERDVGQWSGLTGDQIEDHWPGAVQAWRAGELTRPPGGESDRRMARRVLEVLYRLVDRPVEALLVVTHGGVLRLLDRRLGVESGPSGHLCGRWLSIDGSSLSAGGFVALAGERPGGPLLVEGTSTE